jgi:hypothetical protein
MTYGQNLRVRRTKVQMQELRQMLDDIAERTQPTSVRHIFYQMTNPRLPCAVPKTEKEGYNVVQSNLAIMRKAGQLPYGWIVDATRRGYHVATYRNRADFIRRMAGLYRADMWAQSDAYVEVWCESRSIAGVIEDTCEELAVSLYPAGGFSSLTLEYDAAQQIAAEVRGTDKTIEVIYVGDYDPAGVLIDKDIEAKLRGHLKDAGIGNPLTFHRLAITAEQIAQYDLPTKPRKDTDIRAKHIERTVEAEALDPSILRPMLRQLVESFLPERALEVARVAEENERQGLEYLADAIESAARRSSGDDDQ